MGQHYAAWARGRIKYFYQRFGSQINQAFAGTPYPASMVVGVAIQETGYIWNAYETKKLSDTGFLELCVGDSIGFGSRSRWPTSKSQLLSVARGDEVFASMRDSLEKRAALVGGSAARYAQDPNNIMMACGPWQYDIGFVRWAGPEFFAEKKWASLEECLSVFYTEIEDRRKRLKIAPNNLSRYEMALIGTSYNTGWAGFKPSRGLQQGFRTQGRYYGQRLYDFIGYARSIVGDTFADRR